MKTEVCLFSGFKIYPGHGKRAVKADGKVHIFINGKCESAMRLKKNPREVTWTVLYRRKNKKGTQAEEISKKRSRKTTKFQRPIGNTSLAEIIAKRNQKPEFRRAQREQAIKAAKEKTRSVKAVTKAEKSKGPKVNAPKAKAMKPMSKGAPRVSGKR